MISPMHPEPSSSSDRARQQHSTQLGWPSAPKACSSSSVELLLLSLLLHAAGLSAPLQAQPYPLRGQHLLDALKGGLVRAALWRRRSLCKRERGGHRGEVSERFARLTLVSRRGQLRNQCILAPPPTPLASELLLLLMA